MNGRRKFISFFGVGVWLVLVAVGMTILMRYENAPGRLASPPADWPATSAIARDGNRATLVMLAHPRCPCTRAGIGELNRLMARVGGRLNAHVAFYRPEGTKPGWARTDLWDAAAAIPGVNVIHDEANRIAKEFRVETSSQVVLYDRKGRLMFHGGITPSRGHAGDSPGRDIILAKLTGNSVDRHDASVFGCPIDASSSGVRCEEESNCRKQ